MSSGWRARWEAIFVGSTALALTALAFLPWAGWLGYEDEAEGSSYLVTASGWLLWTGLIILAAIVASWAGGTRLDAYLERWRGRALRGTWAVFAAGVTLSAALAGIMLSGVLFERNPHLVDTIAQLFQARIFAEGSLTAPAPEFIEFFGASHLLRHGGRWFSQYPPGHPALLTVGILADVPWVINPLFAAGSVLLAFLTARRLLGDASARLAATLYLLSPFALFMSASYMNHVTTGFFLTLALYLAVRAAETDAGVAWAVLTGVVLGLAALIRPLEAAAWAAVLGGFLLVRRDFRSAAAAALGCLIAVTPLLAYNAHTTGHPLRFGYTLLWGPGHGLGFHTDPWGEPFTPVKSLAITALDFQRLNSFLFQWPFASLTFVIAALVLAAPDKRVAKHTPLLAALLLAGPLAYFFYWHRDNFLGPRFLYPSLVPAILLTAVGIAAVDRRAGRWRSAVRLTVLAWVVVAVSMNLPNSAGIIAGRLPGMKLHPDRAAERAGLRQGLVFVRVGWGSRLIPRMWSWGVPAAEAEQTYRVVDGCRLQLALDRADSLAAVGVDSATARAGLLKRLSSWRAMRLPVVHERWPEPSVRFDTTRVLADRCRQEILADTWGYSLYGTLVWLNDPWLRNGVIFARDLGSERNRRLMRSYPAWEYYSYAPTSGEPGARPVLRPLAIPHSAASTTGRPDAPRSRRERPGS